MTSGSSRDGERGSSGEVEVDKTWVKELTASTKVDVVVKVATGAKLTTDVPLTAALVEEVKETVEFAAIKAMECGISSDRPFGNEKGERRRRVLEAGFGGE